MAKPNSKRKSESGTIITMGMITTDEYVNELIGRESITTYDQMIRSNSTVSETVDLVTLPIRTATFDFKPVSTNKRDIEVADFVHSVFFDGMNITWDELVESILEMLPFGFSLFEKVMKPIEWNGTEKYGIDLYYIGQKSVYAWEMEDGKPGITQHTDGGYKTSIKADDLLRFTYRKRGDNYAGQSVLRPAYPHWYNVINFYKISSVAYERTALAVPLVTVPANANETDKKTAEKVAKNMRANEHAFASLPDGYKIEMLDMKGNTTIDPMPLITHHNTQIARAALTEFMHIGQNPNGSYGASYDQSSMFEKAQKSVSRYIEGVFNQLIREVVNLNFFDVKEYPKLEISNIARDDLATYSTVIQRLYQSGAVTPDPITEQYLRAKFKIIEKPDGEINTMRPNEMETTKDTEEKKTASVKKKPDTAAEQRTDGGKWARPFTAAEKKLNFDGLEARIDKGEKALTEALKNLSQQQIDDLMLQVRSAVESTDTLSALNSLAVTLQNQYGEVILSDLRGLFEYAKVSAADEMEAVLGNGTVNAPGTSAEEIDKLRLKATTIAAQHADVMKAEAVTTAAEYYAGGRTADDIVDLTSKVLEQKAEKRIKDTAGISVIGSINQGRTFTQKQNSDKIYAYQYSAILDKRTCNTCAALDGRTISKNDPAYLAIMPPQHFYCRCVWVEILNDEFDKPPIDGIPSEISVDNTPSTFKPITDKELKSIENE